MNIQEDILAEARLLSKIVRTQRSEIAALKTVEAEQNAHLSRYAALLDEAQALLHQQLFATKTSIEEIENTKKTLREQAEARKTFASLERAQESWILGDSWLSGRLGGLLNIENLAFDKKWETALERCTVMIGPGSTANAQGKIEARLLRACIHRFCDRPERGLQDAESALAEATFEKAEGLAQCAQFVRGTCEFALGRFKDAEWCFTLASGDSERIEKIMYWKERARAEISKLSKGDRRRLISPDFLLISQLEAVDLDQMQ